MGNENTLAADTDGPTTPLGESSKSKDDRSEAPYAPPKDSSNDDNDLKRSVAALQRDIESLESRVERFQDKINQLTAMLRGDKVN